MPFVCRGAQLQTIALWLLQKQENQIHIPRLQPHDSKLKPLRNHHDSTTAACAHTTGLAHLRGRMPPLEDLWC